MDSIAAIRTTVHAMPKGIAFPSGYPAPIMTAAELGLLADYELRVDQFLSELHLQSICNSTSESYLLVILAVRFAIHAVRTNTSELLQLSAALIASGGSRVDWRDALVALSALEECSSRLGVEFTQLTSILLSTDNEQLQNTISQGYLSRSAYMRSLDVMGLRSYGEGKSFDIRSF